MTILEMGEKIAKEIDDKIDGKVISAVVYGTEIQGDPDKAKDCNMVIVLDKVGLRELKIVEEIAQSQKLDCVKTPLVLELADIEGMGDSVPYSILDVFTSYQTVYGKSFFKGISSISHEHLRAQMEQMLRENLITARKRLMKALKEGGRIDDEIIYIKNILKRCIKYYMIFQKPWLTDDSDKWVDFLDEFNPSNILLRDLSMNDPTKLSQADKFKLASAFIEDGIKPLLKKVDEMGPDVENRRSLQNP
jgi:hypothetical protein